MTPYHGTFWFPSISNPYMLHTKIVGGLTDASATYKSFSIVIVLTKYVRFI
jgi:hypothetical protein